jgi:hypothetical protein
VKVVAGLHDRIGNSSCSQWKESPFLGRKIENFPKALELWEMKLAEFRKLARTADQVLNQG